MKHHQLKNFILATAVGIWSAIPGVTLADDTEIYLGSGQVTGQQVKPNVLFVLDTSGSMSATVSGTGMSRLDNMKQALKTILTDSNNINVGLMRFTDPGGPILFPVSDIDANVADIEGTGDSGIIRQIDPKSSDDAEELTLDPGPGTVFDAHNDLLTLGAVAGGMTTTQTINLTTMQDSDTQEESVSSGNVTSCCSWINMQKSQINGIRFPNVDVPQGAIISSAKLGFTAQTNDSGDITLIFQGELPADADADPFTSSQYTVSSRLATPTTSTMSWVDPVDFANDSTYISPDLSPIIQEIVDDTNWASGNALALVQTASDPTSGTDQRTGHTHYGAGSNQAKRTSLEISYDVTSSKGDNSVGMRFNDIGIPQGATVISATLEFTAKENSNDAGITAKYDIYAEKSNDSTTFSVSDDISGRTLTTSKVAWDSTSGTNPLTEWVKDQAYKAPDLTSIVQEVVDQAGWCGNNSMSFVIKDAMAVATPAVARKAYSSDFVGTLSDPGPDTGSTHGPRLTIKYDFNSVPAAPGGCFNQIIQRQILTSTDDAEETISSGGISLTGGRFDMDSGQINGLRFQDIDIPQGATILEANVILTAYESDGSNTNITWYAQDIDDAPTFSSSTSNISSRTKTTASVTETMLPWNNADDINTTTNLSALIKEVVDRPGWSAGNDLVLIQTSTGSRGARTYNNSAIKSPVLTIKIQYSGTQTAPLYKTVRERLKEIVDTLPNSGYTPNVGTLYEGVQYYRGGPVFHGARRSHRSAQFTNTRISHPASYTGGAVNYPAGCTEDNLSASACAGQTITGSPVYTSPIDVGCQANYIVLLTDGFSNHNANEESQDHGVSLVDSLVTDACTTGGSGEKCGLELAKFMATEDQRADLAGDQTIKLYTIGFNISTQWLKDMADADHGQGAFYEAQDAASLAATFQAILADILNKPTSFATPSLSVNAFNKLFHRNEVYFSLFEPSNNVAWEGNVKKYRICDLVTLTSCTLGEILDDNNISAIGSDNRILDSSTSVWSSSADGIEVQKGGAAENIPVPYTARSVYTYTDPSNPNNADLTTNANAIDGDIPDTDLTKDLLGDAGMSDQARLDNIEWTRGKDVDDNFADAQFGVDRFVFEDPLHASPVAVTFGGTEANPVDKLFVATNGGGLRMVNATTGEEEWLFIPQDNLDLQSPLRINNAGSHIYGLDLTPTIWLYDHDSDGKIEPLDSDFVRVVQGMRRGGNNLYMVDATPSAELTDPNATTGSDPTLMWRIRGGIDVGFENLGETWSQPKVTQILMIPSGTDIVKNDVVIFAGGNDNNLDKQFDTSNTGNIVYVVDALTGALITSIGGTGTTAKHKIPGMDYPIVSDLALLDANGDGATDRIYFGDLGGNVWRIDLNDELKTSSTGSDVGIVGKLASFSLPEGAVTGPHAIETRKFYSAPDVVQVKDAVFSNESRYDLIYIGTGSRPDPLNTIVRNRFFAIRDYLVDELSDVGGDGIADTSCSSSPCTEYPVRTLSDLVNLTTNPLQLALDGSKSDGTAYDAAVDDMRGASGSGGFGWYLNLQDIPGDDGSYIGEKVLSKPVVLAGKLFFTTYIPIVNAAMQNSCELSEGTGRLWGLNALTGAALFEDWDNDGSNISDRDRYYNLGGGIPSDAVPIFQKEGVTIIVGGGGGATTVDPEINLPRDRTYWLQRNN